MQTLYIKIYTLIYYLILPFLLLRLMWRSRRNPAYRYRWQERFGFAPSQKQSIWVHAVSVGETIAAIPLIHQLQHHYPDYTIIVTTTTPTGSAQVKKNLGDSVIHVYLAFDIPSGINRFLQRTKTKFCIIMETEIWPNLLRCCEKKKIPVVMANARLSARSLQRYRRITKIMRPLLNSYTTVIAQSREDGERFIQLGLNPERLIISGNIKFDLELDPNLQQQGLATRCSWKSTNRPTFIIGSSHEGEESILLQAFAQIKKEFDDILLIIAPRHPERFDRVFQLCTQAGFRVARRSRNESAFQQDILVADTMGELRLLYATSDIAFVGGTLVPIGGHNLIEPAAMGLPILSGPNLQNCSEIGNLLKCADALILVKDAESIAEKIKSLLLDPILLKKIGENARNVVNANRGALEKHLQHIKSLKATRKKIS